MKAMQTGAAMSGPCWNCDCKDARIAALETALAEAKGRLLPDSAYEAIFAEHERDHQDAGASREGCNGCAMLAHASALKQALADRTRERDEIAMTSTAAIKEQIGLTERMAQERTEDRAAIWALKDAGDKMHRALDELLTEFVSKKRAANWGVINDAGVALGKANQEHALAIARAQDSA